MRVVSIDPRVDALWRRLVEKRESDVFHSPEWLHVLSETYGMEIRAHVALDDSGEPVAGVPLGQISDIMGKRMATLPFSDYCDPLARDPEEWSRLAEPLLAERQRYTIRCLHNSIPMADDRFEVVNRARWHGLDLRPDLETLWRGFDDSARRAVRKAEKSGVTVRAAETEEELRAFFNMHLGLRKYKYRLLAQPYRFFESIWRGLIQPGKGRLMLAVHQEEIIGGVLFLEWKDALYYKFNASSPRHLALRPNDLVIWSGIQYGKAKGFRKLDFGLSDWDQEDLVRYKRKYASEEKTISFLRHEPNGGPNGQEKELRQLLHRLTALFVDESVPDGVSDRAGELLYRYFV